MSAVVKDTHLIGGIQVNVYKLEGLSESIKRPHSIAILFLLHGRKGSAKDIDPIARKILEKNTDQQQRELWVVTLVKHIPFLVHVISIHFVATFRIIVTMEKGLSNQGLIVLGPIKSAATSFMRMFVYSSFFNHKKKKPFLLSF
jgi:hypothetical protein